MKLDLVETYLNNNYDTDKYYLGYLEHFYSPIFTPYKNDKIKILEIGVRYGGSIELWRDFFVNGDVYGIDNNDEHIAYPDGCNVILGDAYDDTFVEQFKKEYFDIIVDDGPHTYQSFINVMEKYFDKIKVGGILIIEDIIRPLDGMGVTPEQQEYLKTHAASLGYSKIKEYNMAGKQKTSDLLKKWEDGLFILTLTK
jgi:predicted O-methyltransferase YrrM